MKAIVYTTNTGHTEAYAKLLSEKTGLPCYDLKQAKKALEKKDEIIYMGWVNAGSVKNAEKAAEIYSVKAICAVGMDAGNDAVSRLKNTYAKISTVFFLPSGISPDKLHGIYKMMIGMMLKGIEKKKESGEALSEGDSEMLRLAASGESLVSEENLSNVLVWFNAQQ